MSVVVVLQVATLYAASARVALRVNTDSDVRAPTLSLASRRRLSLITRRLWTDVMISDFRLGVEGFATSALKSFLLEERMTPNA